MGAERAVIHCNPRLTHQARQADAFAAGFRRHRVACEISGDPRRDGDIHVVLGPWFALSHWQKHHRCVHLDRAFWGDPECVSIGWARPDGSRRFPVGAAARSMPELQPPRVGRKAIVLADYGDTGEALAALVRPHAETVTIRRHPAEGGRGTLRAAMAGRHIAVGAMTTALVEAAIAGLAVICRDPRNPVMPVASATCREILHANRAPWLQRLSWANWNHDEIANGDVWEALTTRCAS